MRTIYLIPAFVFFLFVSCGKSEKEKQENVAMLMAEADNLEIETNSLWDEWRADSWVISRDDGDTKKQIDLKRKIKEKQERMRNVLEEINRLDPSMKDRYWRLNLYLLYKEEKKPDQ